MMKTLNVSDRSRAAVAYLRRCDDKQLAEDERVLRDYAAEHGLAIVSVFTDRTGAPGDRAGFKKMVAGLGEAAAPAPQILVRERTTLLRTLSDFVNVEDLNTALHFVDEGDVVERDCPSSVRFKHALLVLLAMRDLGSLKATGGEG